MKTDKETELIGNNIRKDDENILTLKEIMYKAKGRSVGWPIKNGNRNGQHSLKHELEIIMMTNIKQQIVGNIIDRAVSQLSLIHI